MDSSSYHSLPIRMGRARLRRPPKAKPGPPDSDQPGQEVATSSEEERQSQYHREQLLLVIHEELSKSKIISYQPSGKKEPQPQEEIPKPPPTPLPEDFMLPQEISIASRGDKIQEGEVIVCIATVTVSPSLIYLVLENEFYKGMEDFIDDMTNQYNDPSNNWKSLRVPPDMLQVGAVFAVHQANLSTRWLRAKLFERYPPGQKHTFLSLDSGMLFVPGGKPVTYLHKNFCETPMWAIKCRLKLSNPEFDKYHQGIMKWNKKVKTELKQTTYDRPMNVKFIRRVEERGEMIWEVSLLNFVSDSLDINPNRPIQDQIVERYFKN